MTSSIPNGDEARLRPSLSPARRAASGQRRIRMSGDVAALLLALTEIAELRDQLASAQDMLVETAIDVGNMPALVVAPSSTVIPEISDVL